MGGYGKVRWRDAPRRAPALSLAQDDVGSVPYDVVRSAPSPFVGTIGGGRRLSCLHRRPSCRTFGVSGDAGPLDGLLLLRDDGSGKRTGQPMDIGGGCGGVASNAAFRENEINEQVLPSLTQEDLEEGVGPVGHRWILLEAIAALRSDTSPPSIRQPRPVPQAEPMVTSSIRVFQEGNDRSGCASSFAFSASRTRCSVLLLRRSATYPAKGAWNHALRAMSPPSTGITTPVRNEAAGRHRLKVMCATSSGSP
jgi:hypothetical protein